jgi:hypothetical protein
MFGVADHRNIDDTDTNITETPIGSVSQIIDTLGAIANVKNDISNGADVRVSMISDTEPIGVSVMSVSVIIGTQ